MARPRRQLVITLTAAEWDRLKALAARERREPFAQAYWLIIAGLDAADLAERALAIKDLTDVA